MTSVKHLPRGYAIPKHFPLYTPEEARSVETAAPLTRLPAELVPGVLSSRKKPPLVHLCYIVAVREYPKLRDYAERNRLLVKGNAWADQQKKAIGKDDCHGEEGDEEWESEEEVTTGFDAFSTLSGIIRAFCRDREFKETHPVVDMVVNPTAIGKYNMAVSLYTNYALEKGLPTNAREPEMFEKWLNLDVLERKDGEREKPAWRLSWGLCRWAPVPQMKGLAPHSKQNRAAQQLLV